MKKKKWIYIIISVVFTMLLLLPIFGIPVWNLIQNPYDRYRADSATSTGHTIPIDEHYRVHTTSGSRSVLSYTEEPLEIHESDASTNPETLTQVVDRLNWDDNYIIVAAKESNKQETFMIINRDTGEITGYPNKQEFQKGKEAKGIKVSLKNKTAFDWY